MGEEEWGAELRAAGSRPAARTRPRPPIDAPSPPPPLPISEQAAYRVSAIAATVGFFALAGAAVHARFSWGRPDGDVPIAEAVATLLLALGGAVREERGWRADRNWAPGGRWRA